MVEGAPASSSRITSLYCQMAWVCQAIKLGIQRHIKFRLPDASMRRELFALHLPNPDRVKADYAVIAELSRGLSGGDILNICVNAIHAGSVDANPAKWEIKQGMLEREIAKAKKAKAEHSGEKGKNRRMIGFCER
jgi:SpoVK/Ycf46/Vps4 family AAA+-type ATPase